VAKAKVTLLAALALDGSWRTPSIEPSALVRILGVRGIVLTDLPSLRKADARVPGFRWATAAVIRGLAKTAKNPLRVLGTPELHARLLEEAHPDLLMLLIPEVAVSIERVALAAPFLPTDGHRSRFGLHSLRVTAAGAVARYAALR
jgi:hypothetical protein